MFNVTVLKVKDIKKYFVGGLLLILVIITVTKYFFYIKEKSKSAENKIQIGIENLSNESLFSFIEKELPTASAINDESIDSDEEKENQNYIQTILQTQISEVTIVEGDNTEESNEGSTIDKIDDEQQFEVEEILEQEVEVAGTKTEIVTQNPIAESYNVEYDNVKIKNQTSYELTQEILEPDITIENKNIIIFHTHSCESYTSSEMYQYEATGNFRTTDLNYTVTRVGTELEKYLKSYNYNVIHNMDYHDYPTYNGSYTRSLSTVESILSQTQSDIIIDLHRDAVGSRSDYAPAVKIGDTDVAAQIMFVIGTNDGGLYHPNWNQNLKFAIKVQQKAEEMYPGLFKPIMLTSSRYNQHTGKYASIIEVGATGNTLEQCLTSMKYLAKVMDEIMK